MTFFSRLLSGFFICIFTLGAKRSTIFVLLPFVFMTFPLRTLSLLLQTVLGGLAGLSNEEAARRLQLHGSNVIRAHTVGSLRILRRQMRSPFLYVLVAAAVVSFALQEWADGVVVLAFVGINTVLAFVQEYRSEKSIQALQKFVVPTARVIRGGMLKTIPSAEVVVGDMVEVSPGDALPADIRWVEAQAIEMDESVLTGESAPVSKRADTILPENISAEEVCGYAATIVVRGTGRGVAVAIGTATRFGAVSALTLATTHASGFEQGLASFSRAIIKLMLGVVAILFFINLSIKGQGTNIPELLLFSIALAVTVVPEALPLVTTVAFSRGALRLAKSGVVVKRLSAVEDLGSIEVLCTDKTGTITENTLTVAEVVSPDRDMCARFSAIVSKYVPAHERESSSSFDKALLAYIQDKHLSLPSVRSMVEIPFDPIRRRASMLVEMEGKSFLIVRGAPEELSLISKISSEEYSKISAEITRVGVRGERTLGCAYKILDKQKISYDASEEKDLAWLGFISFHDPIKLTAREAIAEARHLGVHVKILTGDHADVAGAVAVEVGLIAHASELIAGPEFEALSETAQRQAVLKYQVFARVNPEQKFLIIQRLQEHGKEVGFLGEGINDAPALKMAEVGIVVKNASDLAREAADIVLLNASLTVIVDGIRGGREIFENVVKYIKITLIGNFGNFFTLAMISLILPYVPLLPIQILLLNILTDSPLIAIATDRVDASDMKRPRSYNLREIVVVATTLGLVSTVFDFALFGLFMAEKPEILRTAWFLSSALAEFVVIFLVHSRRAFGFSRLPSRSVLVSIVLASAATVACFYLPTLRRLFLFAPLSNVSIGKILLLTLGYALATEIVKRLYYRHVRRRI